jgi:hypothetical protein
MNVDGIEYLFLDTRNWGKSVAFWRRLGYTLALDLGSSGRLDPPGGGPGIWLEEVSPETPLRRGVYLKTSGPGFEAESPVEMVGPPVESHWGTRLQIIRDPDGREFHVQYTPPEE